MEKIEFKGKEFKGSEGSWDSRSTGEIMRGYAQPFAVADIENMNLIAGLFGDVKGGEDVAEANARLFANSKNLLKAAIEMYYQLHNHVSMMHIELGGLDELESAREADKELKNFETEILKSL